MHPGGMRSAMDLFDFEKSANLKHPNEYTFGHPSICLFTLKWLLFQILSYFGYILPFVEFRGGKAGAKV